MVKSLTELSVEEQIESLTRIREEMVRFLPYADGGAYSQDKQRIRDIDKQLCKLRGLLCSYLRTGGM